MSAPLGQDCSTAGTRLVPKKLHEQALIHSGIKRQAKVYQNQPSFEEPDEKMVTSKRP